jgi:hypothetical protein
MDIGAVRDFARQKFMAAGVAGKKNDFMPGELTLNVGVGGIAKRRVEAHFFFVREGAELVEPAAADDSNR